MFVVTENSELAEIISNYSSVFHNALADSLSSEKNFIASPLGAWLLMAIIAGSNEDGYTKQERAEISAILQTSIPHAYSLANELLATHNDEIASAVGSWFSPTGLIHEEALAWINSLKNNNVIDYSATLPSESELNDWTAEKTLGIMKEFPGQISEQTQLLISTVLATKISWKHFFNVVPNTLDTWDTQEVLQAPQEHYQKLVASSSGDILGMHATTSSEGGLTVISLIGPETITLPALMNEAHQIAINYVKDGSYPSVSPADIDLVGDFWKTVITQETGYNIQENVYITSLPAWDAESTHDLQDPTLFLNKTVNPLANALDTEDVKIQQAAKAAFNTNGFEAAAVTFAIFGSASMAQKETRTVYTTHINFNKPYVVVAIANHQRSYQETEVSKAQEIWKGIPVFSAVVSTAMEPEAKIVTIQERRLLNG